MRRREGVSAVATVYPRKPLENFFFRFSCPGSGGVWVAREAVYTSTLAARIGPQTMGSTTIRQNSIIIRVTIAITTITTTTIDSQAYTLIFLSLLRSMGSGNKTYPSDCSVGLSRCDIVMVDLRHYVQVGNRRCAHALRTYSSWGTEVGKNALWKKRRWNIEDRETDESLRKKVLVPVLHYSTKAYK